MSSKSFVKMRRAPLVALLCASLSLTPAWAQTPLLALSDLVNQDSVYAQSQLIARGYVFNHTDTRPGTDAVQYWWQNRQRVCAQVVHVNQRASSFLSVSPTECKRSTQTPLMALSDLVNQDSVYAQSQLIARGYVFIHTDTRPGTDAVQYWWQNSERVCAQVVHVSQRASSFLSVSPTDCNQYSYQGSSPAQGSDQSSKASGAAAVAIAAAAIVGVAALAHRSHERDEEKYKTDQDVAEYERGYRDGLYHQAYHDYNRTQAYVDGYNAGQQKRQAETSYRSPSAYHSGQTAYVPVNDLVGARGSSMDGEMQRRGFVNKGGYQSGGQAFTMWWNGSTRQCLQAVTSGGRVQSINPIFEGNCI